MKKNKINPKMKAILMLIALILVSGICAADVSVSEIVTDKASYYPGEIVQFKFNVSIINESGYCVLDDLKFKITDGNSMECDLPVDLGNYQDYNCSGQDINVTVTQKYGDCYEYGGNNVYGYTIYWQIPTTWGAGQYTVKVNMSSGGKTDTSETIFNVISSCTNNQQPQINSIVLSSNSVMNGTPIDVTINITDPETDTLNVTATYDSHNIVLTQNGDTWSGTIDTSTLSGSYVLTVTVNDSCNCVSNASNFFVFGIFAGDPVEVIKTANKKDAEVNDIITYTIKVTNTEPDPIDVYLYDAATDNTRFIGNIIITCMNLASTTDNTIITTATPWHFTENENERASDWWVNITSLPPGITCNMTVTAKVISIINPTRNVVAVEAMNKTHIAAIRTSISIVSMKAPYSGQYFGGHKRCEDTCPVCMYLFGDCGDGICGIKENNSNCPEDCPKIGKPEEIVCGDGKCEGDETNQTCPEDCKELEEIICGDDVCGGDETCENCPEDCGECVLCGDDVCRDDETCENCPEDCGECKLVINCPEEVNVGDTVTCNVTDENGNTIPDATVTIIMPDRSYEDFTTDNYGKIQYIAEQSGTVDASAKKEGYTGAKTETKVKEIHCDCKFPYFFRIFNICGIEWIVVIILTLLSALIWYGFARKKRTLKEEEAKTEEEKTGKSKKPILLAILALIIPIILAYFYLCLTAVLITPLSLILALIAYLATRKGKEAEEEE